jgi:paraquat-inducible protein A
MAETIVSCDTCGLVQKMEGLGPGTAAECMRCGSFIAARTSAGRLELVAALSLAALILYVPANIFPIMKMYMYGAYSESTVWDGVVLLMNHDQWGVAVIVFLASMVIPLVKLAGLFSLVVTSRMGWGRRRRRRPPRNNKNHASGPGAVRAV